MKRINADITKKYDTRSLFLRSVLKLTGHAQMSEEIKDTWAVLSVLTKYISK